MNPFYKLNATLANISNEQKQIAKEVAKAAEKTPARKTLEESLRSDLTSLMEGSEQQTWQKKYDAMMKTPHGRKAIDAAEKDSDPHSINKAVEKHYAKVKEDGTGGMNFSGPGSMEEAAGALFTPQDIKAALDYKNPAGHIYDVVNGKIRFNLRNMDRAALNKILSRPLATQQDWDALKKQMRSALASQLNEVKTKYGVCIVGHNGGKPVKTFDTEAEAKAYADKGVRIDGKLLQGSVRTMVGEADYSAKKAAAGKDIGKPGKNFAKIAKSSGAKYGSKAAGERVAGAVLNKLRHPKEEKEMDEGILGFGLPKFTVKRDYLDVDSGMFQHGGNQAGGKKLMAALQKANPQLAAQGKHYGASGPDGYMYMGIQFPTPQLAQQAAQALQGGMEEGNAFSGAVAKAKADGIQKGETIKVDGKTYPVKEQGAGGIHGSMPDPMTNKDQQKKMNPPRSLEEKDHSEEDIMDYLNRKLAPHDKEQAKEDAVSKPYNGPADAADAYNGMWGTGMDKDLDEDTMEESVSRKHFQQVADLLKNIPDEAKRKEMALHHASIFKQQNPRFDIRRFAQAAGVDLEECAMWEELKGGQVKLDKNHNGKLDANDFAMLRGDAEETDEGWDDAMAAGKAAANQKPAFSRHDVKDTGYSKVYTRKPETFDEPEDGEADADGPKRGRGRPATGVAPNRKTKGAYKHKMEEEGEEMVDEKAEAGKREFFDKLAPAAKKVAKVVGAVTKGKKEVDKESTDKEDTKAEKAGKKVAKDIEHDEGNKGKDDNKAEKAGKKVTKDIEYDDKKDRKEKKADKEEKVDETTTSGSVATATTSGKSSKGGINYGGSIYDSWNRQFETLLAESVNVSQEATKMEDGNEEEAITINVTGDDVARFKEVLASMGLGQQTAPGIEVAHDDSCGTCGGTPCQCDEQLANANGATMTGELDEADVTVSQNEPDYPSNEEESDDALQYSGGLNGPKSTGQTTIPVVASQQDRLHTMEESEDVDSFLNLYQSFKTK